MAGIHYTLHHKNHTLTDFCKENNTFKNQQTGADFLKQLQPENLGKIRTKVFSALTCNYIYQKINASGPVFRSWEVVSCK